FGFFYKTWKPACRRTGFETSLNQLKTLSVLARRASRSRFIHSLNLQFVIHPQGGSGVSSGSMDFEARLGVRSVVFS
ncbi:MAG: hypothetical protein SH818_19020, partial [Saprospiraceae bacterium]|nr:hypothetical protein [Saprospiraceae bacterium]